MIDMNPQPAASREPGQTDPADPEPGERGSELGWPVGAVSERLAIAAPTLRSWDRRHGVGPSLRTRGNHRRYTELDVRRVLLMSRLTAQGVPASRAFGAASIVRVLLTVPRATARARSTTSTPSRRRTPPTSSRRSWARPG